MRAVVFEDEQLTYRELNQRQQIALFAEPGSWSEVLSASV